MNKLSQQELWEKIQNFSLDDPYSSYPFSKKLAQQNNWSISFTNKAIEEYKKFIFLCCISPAGASPSEIVDEVWHLHLTYTKNYWTDFCKNTLGQDIHHHPSKGGVTEKEKHVNWYEETIKLYVEVFGNQPLADIWPQYEKEEQDIAEKIYDPVLMKKVIVGFIIFILFFIIAVDLFQTKGPDFLLYYAIICIGGLALILYTQLHKNNRLQLIIQNNLPAKFTRFEITRFLYGPHRCYQTALIDLLKRNVIEISGNKYVVVQCPANNESEQNPLLNALRNNYKPGDIFSYLEGFGLIDSDSVKHPSFEKLNRLSAKVDYQKLIIPCIVLLIGTARFLQGISRGKPVGFLLMEMALFSIIALGILEAYSYTKSVGIVVNEFWKSQNAEGYGEDILNNFSILGTAAIAGFAEYTILSDAFKFYTPAERKWVAGDAGSGSSCGSSCSSGCGGGGCGGCGGGD